MAPAGKAASGYALRVFPRTIKTSDQEVQDQGKHLHLCTADHQNVGFQPRLNIRSAGWLRFESARTLVRRQGDHPTHVFTYEGNPITQVNTKAWRNALKRAGIEDFRWHDLRHTFASIGAGASLGLPVVGRLLGHSQPQTTARYAHLDADPLRRAADIIGQALTAAMGTAPVPPSDDTSPPA